jgi:hypothetical protein
MEDPKPSEKSDPDPKTIIPDPQHWWEGVVQQNKYKAERWAKFIMYGLADNFYFPNPISSCQVTYCLIHSSPFKTLPFNHNHQYCTARYCTENSKQIFPEMKLSGLDLNSYILHSCICERFIYSHDWSAYFLQHNRRIESGNTHI